MRVSRFFLQSSVPEIQFSSKNSDSCPRSLLPPPHRSESLEARVSVRPGIFAPSGQMSKKATQIMLSDVCLTPCSYSFLMTRSVWNDYYETPVA